MPAGGRYARPTSSCMLASRHSYEPTEACVLTAPYFARALNLRYRQNFDAHLVCSACILERDDRFASVQRYPVEKKPVHVDGPKATRRYGDSRVGESVSGLSLRIHQTDITATSGLATGGPTHLDMTFTIKLYRSYPNQFASAVPALPTHTTMSPCGMTKLAGS